ncbi:MAG TPA: LysR substrate-binding domain-containing protein [Rhodopseudomonas sp.]|uniref:LysR substrate-binding domain-containing protein n=1 Tax=Rhodopseudomonas sp. TaxID=1078 RepID=UPI002EDBA57E
MQFDLVDLRLFAAIAEARSITHGAARCHLALASASARIKALEAGLGVALLRRGRRGVTLTPAGDSLLDHARIVLHATDTLRGDLAAYARGVKASVRLIANTAALSEHLPKALAAFLGAHSNISIDVEERESAEIAEAIASGAADIGLAIDQALPDSIERFAFCDDRLVLVAAKDDAIADRRAVDFAELLQRDFIGLSPGSALQDHLGRHAARLGARLRFRARLKEFDAICQMAAAGVGVAVVPEAAAKRCARAMPLAVLRIRDGWASRKLVICVRDLKALPRPAQQLAEHLRRAAR